MIKQLIYVLYLNITTKKHFNIMKVLQSHSKLTSIQSRLSKQSYLSRSNLPGWADGKMFLFLESIKRYPDRKTYPNFYHWYILMKQFSINSIQKWILNNQSQDDDTLISQFIQFKSNQKLIRSEDLTSVNNNQIQYVMDVKIKQQNKYNMRQLVTNFLHQEEVEHQHLQVIPEERRIRIETKMNAVKFQELKNKISKLEGVDTFESKKKDKKFQTVNSLNNFSMEGRE